MKGGFMGTKSRSARSAFDCGQRLLPTNPHADQPARRLEQNLAGHEKARKFMGLATSATLGLAVAGGQPERAAAAALRRKPCFMV
jgi:hypothetical protein